MIISYLSKVEISGLAFFAFMYSERGNTNETGNYQYEQKRT
ncbi:MAG: hypothetical protein ACOC5R_00645 [Elusimicrobiota bacterium]